MNKVWISEAWWSSSLKKDRSLESCSAFATTKVVTNQTRDFLKSRNNQKKAAWLRLTLMISYILRILYSIYSVIVIYGPYFEDLEEHTKQEVVYSCKTYMTSMCASSHGVNNCSYYTTIVRCVLIELECLLPNGVSIISTLLQRHWIPQWNSWLQYFQSTRTCPLIALLSSNCPREVNLASR